MRISVYGRYGTVALLMLLAGCAAERLHRQGLAAIDRVSAACRNAGKPWAAVAFNPQHAEMLVEKGCRMISPTNDTRVVVNGVAAAKKDFAKFFNMGSGK